MGLKKLTELMLRDQIQRQEHFLSHNYISFLRRISLVNIAIMKSYK